MIFSAIESMRGSGLGRWRSNTSSAERTSSWLRSVVSRMPLSRGSSAQMRSRWCSTSRPSATLLCLSMAARITEKASMPVLPEGAR